jgi:ribosome-binding protein aMBF1 (putative translation factor)
MKKYPRCDMCGEEIVGEVTQSVKRGKLMKLCDLCALESEYNEV